MLFDIALGSLWDKHLHLSDSIHDTLLTTHGLGNELGSNFVGLVSLATFDSLQGEVHEFDNVLHHTEGLCWRAEVIVVSSINGSKGILLQELLLDQLGGLEGDLLIRCKSFFTDKLYQILKGVLLLEHSLNDTLESIEVGIDSLVEIRLKNLLVR